MKIESIDRRHENRMPIDWTLCVSNAFENIKVVLVEYARGFFTVLDAYTINEQHGVERRNREGENRTTTRTWGREEKRRKELDKLWRKEERVRWDTISCTGKKWVSSMISWVCSLATFWHLEENVDVTVYLSSNAEEKLIDLKDVLFSSSDVPLFSEVTPHRSSFSSRTDDENDSFCSMMITLQTDNENISSSINTRAFLRVMTIDSRQRDGGKSRMKRNQIH